jgi:hypothetical protein
MMAKKMRGGHPSHHHFSYLGVVGRLPEADPDIYGLPGFPEMNAIPLLWNGRDNQDIHRLGHLVDPDRGFYKANVFVHVGEGMKTNVDTFNVVPMMDSLLITDSPSHPPPQQQEPDTVYCVIRAKIDDSANPQANYRYYIPPAEPPYRNPTQLGFWIDARDTNYYHYWDADIWSQKKLFYEYNKAQTLPLNDWQPEKFGDLDYKWKVIHDKRSGTCEIDYSEVVDTTQAWGNTWRPQIFAPDRDNWMHPEQRPYMRILSFSEVTNIKNGYNSQADTSIDGKKAHKLIFSYNSFRLGWDIVDWAISHIGVPYGWCGPSGKLPYEKLDCAALATTAKVQELMWPCLPQPLPIGPITSLTYYGGSYHSPPDPPVRLTTRVAIDTLLRVPDFRRTGGRGYLIFIRGKDDNDPDWPTRHILIITYMDLDTTTGMPRHCHVINERGGRISEIEKGRVRYDNALGQWPPYHPDWFPRGKWIWTVLKWEL